MRRRGRPQRDRAARAARAGHGRGRARRRRRRAVGETRRDRPEVAAFVRELVMRQDAEGYARNCEALAAATDPGPIDPALPLLLVTGDRDRVGPPEVGARTRRRPRQRRGGGPPRRRPLDGPGGRPRHHRPPPEVPLTARRPSPGAAVTTGSTHAHPTSQDPLPRTYGSSTPPARTPIRATCSSTNDRIAAVGAVDPADAADARVVEGRGTHADVRPVRRAHPLQLEQQRGPRRAGHDAGRGAPAVLHRVRPHLHRLRLHHVRRRRLREGPAGRGVPRRHRRRAASRAPATWPTAGRSPSPAARSSRASPSSPTAPRGCARPSAS